MKGYRIVHRETLTIVDRATETIQDASKQLSTSRHLHLASGRLDWLAHLATTEIAKGEDRGPRTSCSYHLGKNWFVATDFDEVTWTDAQTHDAGLCLSQPLDPTVESRANCRQYPVTTHRFGLLGIGSINDCPARASVTKQAVNHR